MSAIFCACLSVDMDPATWLLAGDSVATTAEADNLELLPFPLFIGGGSRNLFMSLVKVESRKGAMNPPLLDPTAPDFVPL